MRLLQAGFGAIVVGSAMLAATLAFGAGTPSGGPVHVYATLNATHTGEAIMLTGAIGDYGKTVFIDKNGKADVSGTYIKVTLQKGAFEMNATKLDAKLTAAAPAIDVATCSAQGSYSGPVSLFKGRGLYKGISGTVQVTITSAADGLDYTSGVHAGQCNVTALATKPVRTDLFITGVGTVKFG